MKKRVLKEEEYMRVLEGILRRDYFPDLPPLLFEDENEFLDTNLEDFQAAYTTEDDHSFNKLMDKLNRERRKRYKQTYTTDYQLITLSNPDNRSAIECQSEGNKLGPNTVIPQNTRLLDTKDDKSFTEGKIPIPQPRLYTQQHPVRRNFVPMTPQNNSGLTSPAARNLLRSIRSRAITKESPFGGSTPQRKPK